jgi:septal ring factor EnvC (AmiA/AmiB activator)
MDNYILAGAGSLLAVLLVGFYLYYQDTQARIGILQQNNARLEIAIETQTDSINYLETFIHRQAEAITKLQRTMNKAETDYNTFLRDIREVESTITNRHELETFSNTTTNDMFRDLERVTRE